MPVDARLSNKVDIMDDRYLKGNVARILNKS